MKTSIRTKNNIGCFIGHRKVADKERVRAGLEEEVERLIVDEGADTFLFGSKSEFNDMSYQVVSELKVKYPNIIRVYVRTPYYVDKNASPSYIYETYERYLLNNYDKTYCPKTIINAGRLSYIKRNQEMIDKSDICIFYYDENYKPQPRTQSKRRRYITIPPTNSGTKLALDYAKQKKKKIIYIKMLSL